MGRRAKTTQDSNSIKFTLTKKTNPKNLRRVLFLLQVSRRMYWLFVHILFKHCRIYSQRENDVNESKATLRNTLSRKKMIYIRSYGKWHYLHLLFVKWDEKERTQYPFFAQKTKVNLVQDVCVCVCGWTIVCGSKD